MKKLLFVLLVFLISNMAFGQNIVTVGKYKDSKFHDAIVNSIGNTYLAVGYMYNNDPLICKFDSNGNVLWHKGKLYSKDHVYTESAYPCVVYNSIDNTYAVFGRVINYNNTIILPSFGNDANEIIKLDSKGNVLFNKYFGTKVLDEVFSAVYCAIDNTYVAVGYCDSPHRPIIYKIDNNGNVLWQKEILDRRGFEFLSVIYNSNDNTYIAAGTDWDQNAGTIYKFDSNGKVLWHKEFLDIFFNSITYNSNDNTCLVVGYGKYKNIDGDYEYYNMFKFDSNGNLLLKRNIEKKDHGDYSDNNIYFDFITYNLNDNTYVAILEQDSYDYEGKGIIKFDVNGKVLWSEIINSDYIKSIRYNPIDNTYILSDSERILKLNDLKAGPTVAVTGVTLNKTTASVAKGATLTLVSIVAPSNATNKKVTWSSSNKSIATVSTSGVVKGVAAGIANIVAKTVDGSKTATCKVTVTK